MGSRAQRETTDAPPQTRKPQRETTSRAACSEKHQSHAIGQNGSNLLSLVQSYDFINQSVKGSMEGRTNYGMHGVGQCPNGCSDGLAKEGSSDTSYICGHICNW